MQEPVIPLNPVSVRQRASITGALVVSLGGGATVVAGVTVGLVHKTVVFVVVRVVAAVAFVVIRVVAVEAAGGGVCRTAVFVA